MSQKTYKKLPAFDLTEDLVTQDEFGDNAVRVEGSLTTFPADVAITFNTTTLSLPLANTEYSWAIPDGTKKVTIQLRETDSNLLMASTSGSSSYFTIRRGNYHEMNGFNSSTNTLYFKASKPSKTVEIIYWT